MKSIFEKADKHWAFQPINPPPIPDSEFPNFIDSFINKGLKEQSLAFAKPANRQTIIRRIYHDLIGLKPSFEQVNAFVNDKTPNAYAKMVDQLLASPRLGERSGPHWLDVARYADTKGYLAGGESRA